MLRERALREGDCVGLIATCWIFAIVLWLSNNRYSSIDIRLCERLLKGILRFPSRRYCDT